MTKKIIENNCPMRATMKIIGGKWKPIILQQVNGETKRFGEFLKLIPEITKQMLTKNLRELEKDGKVYAVVPPKVEYSLSKKGKTLIPVFEIMAIWGMEQVKSR